ncbi:MAG: aminoglycoside phosphotransferase family protein [Deltaproteobacteria bacterium]|nr:aminoglycoside phosphotransferase family protein [Deltaproteobacteria bacterium]
MKYDLRRIVKQFQINAHYVNAVPYGTGHINDTFLIACNQSGCEIRFILQRINHSIFNDPPALMNNIIRVTCHIRDKMQQAGYKGILRRVLTVIPAYDGGAYYRCASGNYWRMYHFIEGARTYDVLQTIEQAYQAAKAFGEFQGYLSDLPEPALVETIPNFHNAHKRYHAFLEVLEKDPCGRAASAKAEIDYLNANAGLFDVLPKLVEMGRIPVRTTHNDTKINNVMIDDETHEGVCVIDLDTVMPGLSLYDFGDIVRTTASNSQEDEKDLSKVRAEIPRFKAIVKGYLAGAGSFLNQAEVDHLVHSGKLITMVIGTRFLTDYLNGDHYFKIHRENHNLERCRTQFKLVESLSEQEEILNQLVKKYHQIIVKDTIPCAY